MDEETTNAIQYLRDLMDARYDEIRARLDQIEADHAGETDADTPDAVVQAPKRKSRRKSE